MAPTAWAEGGAADMLRQAALCFEDSAATDAKRFISAVNLINAALGGETDDETDKRRWDRVTAQCGAQFLQDKVHPESSVCGCGIHTCLPVRQDRPRHMRGHQGSSAANDWQVGAAAPRCWDC